MTLNPLSKSAATLLAALRTLGATSRGCAVTHRRLAEHTGLKKRPIIKATAELVRAGYLALAACTPPFGVWIGSVDEARYYRTRLRNRCLNQFRRYRDIGRGIAQAEARQLDLFQEVLK